MTDNPAHEYMLGQVETWDVEMRQRFDDLRDQGTSVAHAYAQTLDEFGMARNPHQELREQYPEPDWQFVDIPFNERGEK